MEHCTLPSESRAKVDVRHGQCFRFLHQAAPFDAERPDPRERASAAVQISIIVLAPIIVVLSVAARRLQLRDQRRETDAALMSVDDGEDGGADAEEKDAESLTGEQA